MMVFNILQMVFYDSNHACPSYNIVELGYALSGRKESLPHSLYQFLLLIKSFHGCFNSIIICYVVVIVVSVSMP